MVKLKFLSTFWFQMHEIFLNLFNENYKQSQQTNVRFLNITTSNERVLEPTKEAN